MKLMIIWGSSRTARKGGVVTNWVNKASEADSRFEVDFVDLKELNLPFFDEEFSPFTMASKNIAYSNPAGKAWADRVAAAEGFIIITPEYNRGYPGVLKNALDWVGPQWGNKPVGFISYGGVSAGIYALAQLRIVTIELGLIQVANAINFQYFEKAFGEDGQPLTTNSNEKLASMFGELARLSAAFSKTT